MNGIDWMAARIIESTTIDQRRALRCEPRFNPRPPGVIRPDSGTEAVLALLRDNPHRQWSRYQIVLRTGRTTKAVDWALLYLKTHGFVACVEDATRNPQYLRYAIRMERT